MTLAHLIDRVKAHSLSYDVIKPNASTVSIPPFITTKNSPSVLFLLNFTTAQRSALLTSPSTLALLYTPTNEHFGIGPVEAMYCGVPVLACNSGGPTESVVDADEGRTGWLREPDPQVWADTLAEIVDISSKERRVLSEHARTRAREYFSMEAMTQHIEKALHQAIAQGPVPAPFHIMVLLVALLTALIAYLVL